VSLQRSLLLSLIVLILVGIGLDVLIRAVGPGLASALGIEEWLRRTFSLPAAETLRNLLVAAAAGTATILGLVVSISLIVWQTTADRYRSSTIVSFLLRERLGAAVVRLLALGFSYSLWVLALLEILGIRLYASAGLALILSTAAVLSLISYRQVGLLGYLPQSIARSLRQEMIRELQRVTRKKACRSVENYSRQVIASDLQIFSDLITRLKQDNELVDVAACVRELGAVLAYYEQVKHLFHPDSLFFERQQERLGSSGFEIEEAIVSEGLMNPTASIPDHLWLERRLLQVAHGAAEGGLARSPALAEALFRLWSVPLQYAWHWEDPEAVDLILKEVENTSVTAASLEAHELVEQFMSIPWAIVEMIGRGPGTTNAAIVEREPWHGDDQIRDLPWQAQEAAREFGKKISRERAIVGRVITPRSAMILDVARAREPWLTEFRQRMVNRATALCATQLETAVQTASPAAPVIARMALRTLLRIAYHGLKPPDVKSLASQLLQFAAVAEGQDADDLREDSGRAARVFAEHQEWSAAYDLLSVCEAAGGVARSRETDQYRSFALLMDSLLTAAAVYAWGEYYEREDHLAAAGQYVDLPFANLDVIATAIDNHTLWHLMFPTVRHYQWFQPLLLAAHQLEDRPVHDSGIAFSIQKSHPSSLFAHAGGVLALGPQECLEHLVRAVVAARDRSRHHLIAALGALIARRGMAK
jgi:hypothetical protein